MGGKGKRWSFKEKRTALELEEREGLCYGADRTAALPQRRSDVVDSVADFLRHAQASYEDCAVSRVGNFEVEHDIDVFWVVIFAVVAASAELLSDRRHHS